MRNGIAGIDHVIVGVRDLDRARMGWTRLGFTLSPRGRHIGQGTANYCIMFASDFLELLGIVDANDCVQHLAAFLSQREGLRAVAFAPAGTPEEVRSALLQRRLIRYRDRLQECACCWVEKKPAFLLPLTEVVLIEVEHVQQRAREVVIRSAANPTGAPIVLDKAQDGALIGQRVIDEVPLGER